MTRSAGPAAGGMLFGYRHGYQALERVLESFGPEWERRTESVFLARLQLLMKSGQSREALLRLDAQYMGLPLDLRRLRVSHRPYALLMRLDLSLDLSLDLDESPSLDVISSCGRLDAFLNPGDDMARGMLYNTMAIGFLQAGALVQAQEFAEEALTMYQRAGSPYLAHFMLLHLCDLSLRRSRLHAATAELRRAEQALAESNLTFNSEPAIIASFKARIAYEEGRFADCPEDIEPILDALLRGDSWSDLISALAASVVFAAFWQCGLKVAQDRFEQCALTLNRRHGGIQNRRIELLRMRLYQVARRHEEAGMRLAEYDLDARTTQSPAQSTEEALIRLRHDIVQGRADPAAKLAAKISNRPALEARHRIALSLLQAFLHQRSGDAPGAPRAVVRRPPARASIVSSAHESAGVESMIRIGVDVGGTNTDAVVMAGKEILAGVKAPTSADVTTGLMQALREVLAQAAIAPHDVSLLVIGTTHFTNAVIERRHLSPTAVVRLCLPAAQCLPPMVDWPADLKAAVGDHVFLASGGVEFDGQPIAPFEPAEISRIGALIRQRGITAIAVAGVFAPVKDYYEQQVAALLAAECPSASITLSSSIGQLGLLERENATILNSALKDLARSTVAALRDGVVQCGLSCPVYLSQNDGTLMGSAQAERFPVLTFASGPTNSMRGAAFLSGRSEAIVIDIGGTTTDVGLLHKGFPRPAGSTVDVGGVRTNFRMPDVFSIGLGGGSIVMDGPVPRLGPQSVGYELSRRARVFGGDTLTASDIAVAAGRAVLGDAARVRDLDVEFARRALAVIDDRLAVAADRARMSPDPIPVIAVGGGSILMPKKLGGLEVIRPANFAVANAIGAAIAQTSGEVDRIYSLEHMSREAALADAENEARAKAVAAGALPHSMQVTEREDVPLAYLRGNATRVRVKVIGDMGL